MSESNSDASQTQVSEQQDNRVVTAPDSVALVASRSSIGGNVTINNTSTDHDSVGKSFDFARQIAKGAADESAASIATIKAVSTSAMERVQSAYDSAYKDVGNKIAGAYTEAKAGEQKVLVGGALLLGTIVAMQALKRS